MNSYCICCDTTTKWKKVTSLPSFLFGVEGGVFKCTGCTLGKTLPVPKTTVEFYEDNQNYDTLFMKDAELYKGFAQNLLKQIKEKANTKHNTLLDIGCGGGFLVRAANEMGFSAQGIDANYNVIRWAKNQGIPVEQGDIEAKVSNHEKYDIVVLSAVVEHFADPKALLMQSKELLKPDGIMLISQASYDGLLPKLFPWGWYGWQPEEHFWHFTPESFARLLNSCGLRMKQCERNSLYHQFYFSGGLKNIIGRNVAASIARIGRRVGKGDNFDCVAVKLNQS